MQRTGANSDAMRRRKMVMRMQDAKRLSDKKNETVKREGEKEDEKNEAGEMLQQKEEGDGDSGEAIGGNDSASLIQRKEETGEAASENASESGAAGDIEGSAGPDDDPSDTGGKKKKINYGNVLKNVTRGIGRFSRKLRGKRDLIPEVNVQKRTFTIEFHYDAPEFGPGESPDHPKHRSGYANSQRLDGSHILNFIKKGSGTLEKGRLDWSVTSTDLKPDNGEHIKDFTKAKMTCDSVADPDYFSLLSLDDHSGPKLICSDTNLTGTLAEGPSKMGYEPNVKSLPGLTKAPNNSDWNYTVEIEMEAWVPYSEDLNEKDNDKPENKRPWWHKYWYGKKLPVRT